MPERIEAALRGMASVRCLPDRVILDDAAALPVIARALSDGGLYRWRREAFDVRAQPDGPVLTRIDRGAIPSFGIQATGVHVNGLVDRPDGPASVGRSARRWTSCWTPGSWTTSSPAAFRPGWVRMETLIKEAGEEAAIPPEFAARGQARAIISYAMERAEGLRRDVLYCYDLVLPEDFIPQATDGEVASFELWPVARVVETVLTTDDFKFNVNLVLIDLFIRLRLIDAT